MKIRVVTPVVEPEILQVVRDGYAHLAQSNTQISVTGIKEFDVPGFSDQRYESIVPEMVQRVQEAELESMDAVVLDCMGDPGLEVARQLVSIPVVGPAQAACHLALCLGANFSIVALEEDVSLMKEVAARNGLLDKLVSVRVMEISYKEIAYDSLPALEPLVDASYKAVTEDGAHIVIPGCTATTGLSHRVAERLAEMGHPVPVLEPSRIALSLAESLVQMGVSHSRRTYVSAESS
jgi:allantoin racemase